MDFITNSVSVKGRLHDKNEDSFVCNNKYLVIADGMGGEADGDLASKMAIESISSILDESLDTANTVEAIRTLLFSAIEQADNRISQYTMTHPEADGMGTTVLLVIYKESNLYIAWCGDSRCYYYHPKKRLCSLTKDHSYVQQLIDEKKITVEESYTHPDNNLITKYVGGGADTCKPEFTSSQIDEHGLLILCSDGLSGYCRNENIEKVIKSSPIELLPDRLVELAKQNGSDDDITVITLSSNFENNKSSIFEWLKKLTH